MAISFESALGVHDKALLLRSQRAEVLANNIANADTPGYKSRDMDFNSILKETTGNTRMLAMTQSNSRHYSTAVSLSPGADLLYRTPLQPSLDGNTVDLQMEEAEYAKNALGFQTSFTFLNSKFRGLLRAIKGE